MRTTQSFAKGFLGLCLAGLASCGGGSGGGSSPTPPAPVPLPIPAPVSTDFGGTVLSNPAVPRVVAQVDTNTATGPALNGCWGVYKFPGAPLMICSDITNGFNLIGITGQ